MRVMTHGLCRSGYVATYNTGMSHCLPLPAPDVPRAEYAEFDVPTVLRDRMDSCFVLRNPAAFDPLSQTRFPSPFQVVRYSYPDPNAVPEVQMSAPNETPHPRPAGQGGWVFGYRFLTVPDLGKVDQPKVINLHRQIMVGSATETMVCCCALLAPSKRCASQSLGCTRTQRRHFRARFGVSAQSMSGLRRFSRALVPLVCSGAPLVDIAGDAGYSDQSHFTRDFRRKTGQSPGAFLRYWQGQESVRIVQDLPQWPLLRFAILVG